ncbi:U3 small nucleolar RNA-associated protein 6 homolog isoform X1 [Megalops cyprinoides]|uniref:U3 small nucleolar RNA-associated protein 6 homolog isoform X1 n=1 Tax=Megalops cyprinoides TaxID=118141 RepID=UPI001863D962|nr:U3 small nucleolar RNA-associated protein 6 homolog isoform X1 [Megalops cyprinoides]
MAEIIQQRVEDRIPELEQLERVGLFTKKEVKAMIKKATALEYKLHRITISKEDFITYIQHEINVLELIKKRRLRIGYTFKREEIEFPVINRIHNVFRRATAKWKDDVQLWLSHVAFTKKWNTKAQLSKIFSSLLAIHSDKPALWIMAAKCEMEDRNSSESARHLFLRALRFHPENKKVYQEYFRMELMHAEKLRKQQKELEQAQMDLGEYEFSPEIMNGKLAEVVYKDATEKIKDVDFVLSLLKIAEIFDFTKELKDLITQDLQSRYADDPLTWDYMAKRELEAGLGAGMGAELPTAKGRATDIARREERCCQVYEEGLKSLNTEAMWTCYITFCLDRFKRKTNVQDLKEKRQARLLVVFQRAHDSSMLQEALYRKWLQVLVSAGDADSAAQVAIAATERFSQSVETWSCSLQISVQLGSANAGRLFQEALKHVNPKESLPLWLLQVEWSASSQNPEETESLFQKGIISPVPSVSTEMKEKYLDWSYRTSGYKKARKTFTSLNENRPFSKAFFTRMIQIEKEQDSPNMNNLRDYYERALREFGSTDDDLWLDYIREELSTRGKAENCGRIHWRAMKSLEGEHVERFIAKYTLLQTGHI